MSNEAPGRTGVNTLSGEQDISYVVAKAVSSIFSAFLLGF